MYVNRKHEDCKVGCLRVSYGHQGKSSYGCMENIFEGCKIGVRDTALSVYVIDGAWSSQCNFKKAYLKI